MALTATATDRVRNDVQTMLGIAGSAIFQGSVNRGNLAYHVVPKPESAKDLLNDMIARIRGSFSGLTGIVYCLSRKDAETVAQALGDAGLRALPYHADLRYACMSKERLVWQKRSACIAKMTHVYDKGDLCLHA